jgi:CHAT domain-containing protein
LIFGLGPNKKYSRIAVVRPYLVGVVAIAATVAISAQSPPATLEVAALQREAARRGSTAIAYWVTDNATVVRVVDREGRATTESIPVTRAKLEQLVRMTWPGSEAALDASVPSEPPPPALRYVTMRSGRSLASAGQESGAYRQLYDLLIAPIRTALPGRESLLTIVPDGPLSQLSFAPLSNENGRFLLEDYRLHYLPGGSSGPVEPQAAAVRQDRFLFVTNPKTPATDREVRDVIRLLGLRDERTLAGKAATETAVRAGLAIARVVHLAGAVEQAGAAVVLAPESGPRAQDGRLTAAEVASLRLSSDLVLLGLSRAIDSAPGETTLSLPRAFLSAGAHTTLATLWDIAEESWDALVPRFYAEWQKNGDKSGALRVAQLSLLRDLRAGRLKVNAPAGDLVLSPHPLLWANLLLIGEP